MAEEKNLNELAEDALETVTGGKKSFTKKAFTSDKGMIYKDSVSDKGVIYKDDTTDKGTIYIDSSTGTVKRKTTKSSTKKCTSL